MKFKNKDMIPFYDSRKDIFYGHDQMYTSQVKTEDEANGFDRMSI
jgi:hypothetical protein